MFTKTRIEVLNAVYEAFYSKGWQAMEAAEMASLLDSQYDTVWPSSRQNTVAGFLSIRVHPEDQMGEIHILAVSPDKQRQGIGRTVPRFAENEIHDRGMKMVMVERVGGNDREPARRTYELFSYRQWPVARYFKPR